MSTISLLGNPTFDKINYVTGKYDGADTYTIYVDGAFAAGAQIMMKPDTTNLGTDKIKVGDRGTAVIIEYKAAALAGGEMVANRSCHLVWNGTKWDLLNSYL